MAVGLPRRNPYGPPSFFGPELDNPYAQQGNGYMGFLDVAQSVPTNDAPGVGTDAPMQQHDGLFEPVGPQNAVAPVQAEQPPMESYPSEASIERRMKLAQALMGKQQEVNHPLQAIGNAVNQIAGAYLENKAYKDQDKIEQRRRDAYKKALGGNTNDLGALADSLINSNDPALVDKGLEIKLQIAAASQKKGGRPDIETFYEGDESVQKAWDGEKWVEVGRGPRFAKQVAGAGGGGGDGAGGNVKYQQVEMQLPNGQVVLASYNPSDGKPYYQDDKGNLIPVPPQARPVTASTGGTLNPAGWLKLKKERAEGINSLKSIADYAKKAGGLPQGYQRWANDWSAKVKTWLGSQNLTPEEFDQMDASARQQALLGMLRTTIVGPGVMTEQDALRVIEAIGGKVSSALQNPAVFASIIAVIYERKRREVQVLQDEYQRNAPAFGETPEPLDVPDTIAPQGGQQQQSRLPQGVPPPDKRPKGARVSKNGKTYEWTGTGWREVK